MFRIHPTASLRSCCMFGRSRKNVCARCSPARRVARRLKRHRLSSTAVQELEEQVRLVSIICSIWFYLSVHFSTICYVRFYLYAALFLGLTFPFIFKLYELHLLFI